ncbi:MAG TPA: ROK family protein [Ktedonobacterales bacterium]|nr:ROK family protein [Ktedonobacterales bacterium]
MADDAERAIGVEVADGGMRLVAALEPTRGARRWSARLPEPPGPAEAVAAVNELIARALAESDLAAEPPLAVGVALAGWVDGRGGVVRALPLASGWAGFPLAAALAERWGGPVRLHTTTQAAALAEALIGAGREYASICYLALGRTVAAALVAEGAVYEGAHGAAGDVAHWLARADGPRCSCGHRGHLEPIASAQSIVRTMIGRAVDHPASAAAMQAISGGRAEAMTAEQVAALAARGDPVAAGVVGEAIAALAGALANIAALWDPAAIVLGGPLAGAEATFVAPLGELYATLRHPFETPPLVAAALEPYAALAGAVLAARQALAAPAAQHR